MTDVEPTKTCMVCFSQIRLGARRCRFCLAGQDRLSLWCSRHSTVTRLLWSVAIICPMLYLLFSFGPFFDLGADFASHRNDIQVLSAEMTLSDSNHGPLVCVVGKIRNNGAIPWKETQLEAQFLDANGRLIDTARSNWGYCVTILIPDGEMAFKIESSRDFPLENYASVRVFVRSAKDAMARW